MSSGAPTWPLVSTSGKPGDRGRSYGEQAAGRVRRSVEIYTGVFAHYAGLAWTEARERAEAFTGPIEAYDAELLPEIEGIAAGAGLDFEDVLALNLRTELMFGAGSPPGECTAVAGLPEATADGRVLLAQNWDWKPETGETCVMLAAAPAGRPAFVTLVEAGLLAKAGMNEAGIGLVTNTLTCDRDRANPAVPYHAILRRILTSTSMSEAVNAILIPERASSANYLIAHRDGEAIDVEVTPGDVSSAYPMFPEKGVFAHANHFQSPRFRDKDTGLVDGADSLIRLRRAECALATDRGSMSVASLQVALRDHFDLPYAVCTHPDPDLDPAANYATISSLIMDLSEGALWACAGLPCETPYVAFDASELFEAARAPAAAAG